MGTFDELKKKYSCGSLLKKKSCQGRTIRIERLGVHTAERINERISRSAKQFQTETQNAMKLTDETYLD